MSASSTSAANNRMIARDQLLKTGWLPEPEPHGPRPNTLHERMVVRDQHIERNLQAHSQRALVDAGVPAEHVAEIIDLAFAAGEAAVGRIHEIIGAPSIAGSAIYAARDIALMVAEVRLSQLIDQIRKGRGQLGKVDDDKR